MVKLSELELECDRWWELFIFAFSIAGKYFMLIELERVKLRFCLSCSDFLLGLVVYVCGSVLDP
jgi:hypothetical protein